MRGVAPWHGGRVDRQHCGGQKCPTERRRDDGGDQPLNAATLVVYPTALKAESVLHGRARREGCLLGTRVTTFPELTDALARDLGTPPRVLEDELAAVVLADALAAPDVPAAFRRPRRGLVREMLRVMAELKSAYLAPDDVAAVAAALTPGPGAARLAALAQVYAAYERGLTRLGAVDRHGREWRVCDGLASAVADRRRPPTLAGVERIVFAEIYDFSVLQFLIATSLIRLLGDAELVAFAHAENVEATRFLERTWNRFVGDPMIADQVLPTFVERGGRRGSIAAALRGVFARERPAPAPGDGSIEVVVAPDRYREVETAVREVRRRLEAGAAPERIALLARDMRVYGDLIEDVCRRFQVPVYFHKGQPLLANGLVKAALNVLRCVADGFPRSRLEALLESDYLAATPSRLVRVLRTAGFVAESARPFAECVAHASARLALRAAAAETPEQRVARERRRADLLRDGAQLTALMATLRGLDARRTVAGHARAFRRVLQRLGLRPAPPGPLPPPTVRRDARAEEHLQTTLALLGGLGRELGLAPMPLADFVSLLATVLEPLEVEDRAERTGVRALSILDARGLDFDVVHVLGLDDGTFPAPRGESPLWPDALKREANAVGAAVLARKLGPRGAGLPLGGLFRTAREASLEDPFLFFLALSMAEERLVLSYPAVNESGNPTVASPFLEEVEACIAGGLPRRVGDRTELVPPAEECCETAELVARAALARWARGHDAAPDRLGAALAEARPELAARLASIDRRGGIEERRSRYFLSTDAARESLADGFVGRVGSDLGALGAYLGRMRWSPSHLEALGACGFKFFARSALGLDPAEEAEAEVGLLERGTLVHAALAALLAAHPRLPAEREAARALGRAFLAAARAQTVQEIPAKDPALLEVAWGQLAAAVDAVLVREHEVQAELAGRGLVPEYWLERPLELRLDDPGGGPALLVGGRPDRVEVWRRRDGQAVDLRVLDYKMSRSRDRYAPLIDVAKACGTTGFQIPVYLLAALRALPDLEGDAPLAGGYLVLLSDRPEVMKEFTRAALAEVAARIAALVGRARAGRFDVDPEPCDPYCAYRPVCRYQRPPLEEDGGD